MKLFFKKCVFIFLEYLLKLKIVCPGFFLQSWSPYLKLSHRKKRDETGQRGLIIIP